MDRGELDAQRGIKDETARDATSPTVSRKVRHHDLNCSLPV